MDKIGRLKGILSKMKVEKPSRFFQKVSEFGNSDTFNYATNERYKHEELKSSRLNTWQKLLQQDIDSSVIRLPLNGFQEMIILTDQGRLWKYPIDNEQGMEVEKQVPFEDHVFFDHLLDDGFPQDENLRQFMEYITMGLAKNPWMTVDRKHEVINFYKDYFNEKRKTYKEAGYDI